MCSSRPTLLPETLWQKLPEEEEAPLIKKRRRSGTSHSAPDSTVMNWDEADEGMGSGLPDLEPIGAMERRENRQKLILPPDEVEESQVVPPTQIIVQEVVVTAHPVAIVDAGTTQTLLEVNKTVAALEIPRAKEVEIPVEPVVSSAVSQVLCPILNQGESSSSAKTPNLSGSAEEVATTIVHDSAAGRAFLQNFKSADEACKPIKAELDQMLIKLETPGFQVLQNLDMLIRMRTLLQRTSEIKPFLASTGEFLMQWLDKILGNALKLQEVPDEGVDHADLVKKYRAHRAERMDLLSEAEASVRLLELIELREQRLRAQIEADEYERAQLLLELQEVEAQIGASETVMDALASQAMEATIAESEAKSLEKSINLEIDNVKDLVSSTLAFIK